MLFIYHPKMIMIMIKNDLPQQYKIMEDSLQVDYIFKYILVGDTSVGKSCIISSYNNHRFSNNSNPTMGVQFSTNKIKVSGKIIKLQIWDTAGQQSFRTITRAYYKNAIGVILVYDLTNDKSVYNLQSWLNEIQQNSNEKSQIIVVGNKKDISNGKQIPLPENFQKFKKFHTSAKTGFNIDKIFTQLTTIILNKMKKGELSPDCGCGIKRGKSSPNTNTKQHSLNSQQFNTKPPTNLKCC